MAQSHGVCRISLFCTWLCINCHSGCDAEQPYSVAITETDLSPAQTITHIKKYTRKQLAKTRRGRGLCTHPNTNPAPRMKMTPGRNKATLAVYIGRNSAQPFQLFCFSNHASIVPKILKPCTVNTCFVTPELIRHGHLQGARSSSWRGLREGGGGGRCM